MDKLAFFLVFAVALLLVFDTKKGLLAAVAVRPLIECFWQTENTLLGFNPLQINGIVLPILILFKIIISKEQSLSRYPFAIFWAIFILFQILPTVLTISDAGLMIGLNYYFRALNGYAGFLAFQEYFHKQDDFKKLLLAFIIASITPLSMSIYQNILGGVIRTEETIHGLVRNIGFYHDGASLRFYSLQSLASFILYGSYFTVPKQWFLKSLLTAMGLLSVFTVYRMFSKAGYLILAQWAAVWFFLKKQFIFFGFIMVAGFIVISFARFEWVEDIQAVYSKEIGAIQGEERLERTFQGRWFGWIATMDQWAKNSFLSQLIGVGTTGLGAHNDFLRALIGTGIIGLLLYLFLLGWAFLQAWQNYLRDASPLNIVALMLLCMWVVDSIGLTPGAYPGYQIFVWGFVGLAFRGVEGL